jgi:hypothetical protein
MEFDTYAAASQLKRRSFGSPGQAVRRGRGATRIPAAIDVGLPFTGFARTSLVSSSFVLLLV